MAQCQRVEGQVELKCDAHKFFAFWARETNRVSEIVPEKLAKIELNEGTHWHSPGAVMTWHYVFGGRRECLTTKVAEIDEKSKFVCYDYTDGDILRSHYKSFKSKFEVIAKADNKGCFAKWSFEYEKKTEDAPDANLLLDFGLGVTKDIDARL